MITESVAQERRAADLELDVFSGDPVLRVLGRRRVSPNVLLLWPAVVLIAGICITASSGTLSQNALGTALCHDISKFIPGSPAWPCLNGYRPDYTMSFLRDLPTLLVLISVGLAPWLIYKQWQGLRDVFVGMWTNHLMSFASAEDEASFRTEVASANAYFRRIGRSGALIALAAAFLSAPIVAAERQGVFPSYVDTQAVGGSARVLYEQWWATFNNPIAWVYYLLLLTIGAYYVILMNMIGFRAVVLIWRMRNVFILKASPENVDGAYGWRHAREILAASYITTALYGITLAGMSLLLPISVLWVLSVFFLQWLAVLPFYLWIPLALIRKFIRRYKATETASAAARIAEIVNSKAAEDISERNALAIHLERVRSIRALPFRAFRDVVTALFTVLTSAASIYAVIPLLYNVS